MPKRLKRKSERAPKTQSSSASTAILILAAGKGTRLKSRQPKVLHAVAGKPMLLHVIRAASLVLPANRVYAIIGHEAAAVRAAAESTGIGFVLQAEQRGTGHAIMSARQEISPYENIIVLSGDVPLIRAETLRSLLDFHHHHRAAMTVLTTIPPDPTGYGRVIRKRGADIAAIVEQSALKWRQRDVREINSGIYAFQVAPLLAEIDKLKTDNAHREYYLTDVAHLLTAARKKVVAFAASDCEEVLGVNNRQELALMDSILRRRKTDELMSAGVTIFQPESCVIDVDVEIGADSIIDPSVQLLGSTRLGERCRIGSFCVLQDSVLEDAVELRPGCVLTNARVANRATLGPYCHLRPGTEIGEGAHIGNFVETKKTKFGRNSKAGHLTYLGDAVVGENVNVGAGTITCNYDGVNKFPTVIERDSFIGSDATLVAPVKIGEGAYVAAASCVTEDVPADSLVIARNRQVVKPEWARKRKSASKSH